MDDFKEFQGKSLDEAIRGACVFYDLPREKLEIELVQDAKSGIFGLVGARKAIIRARRAPTRHGVGSLFGRAGAPDSGPGRRGAKFPHPASRAAVTVAGFAISSAMDAAGADFPSSSTQTREQFR